VKYVFHPGVPIATLVAIALAGCSSPGPAPVENRTQPSGAAKTAPAPSTGARASKAPPPPTRAAAPAPAEVQAAPVRSSGVQVRPLGGSQPQPLMPAEKVRTEPRGEKLPYSDVALADMRAGRTPATSGSVATPPPTKPAPADATQPSKVEPSSKASPEKTVPPQAKIEPRPEAGAAQGTFSWPARGKVVQGFSEPGNMGISIAGNLGDPILAAADGRVIFSGQGPRGYGNLVIVKHDAETLSVYAHNRALLVKEGENVRRGQKIAELGDSGANRPQLHFEIRKSGKPVDPMKLLGPR